jgi:tricorn protease
MRTRLLASFLAGPILALPFAGGAALAGVTSTPPPTLTPTLALTAGAPAPAPAPASASVLARVAPSASGAALGSPVRRVGAEETRLLRDPAISAEHIAFTYGSDLWIVDRAGGEARRLTATPAIVSGPHFSPDGRRIAFTSAEQGVAQVHVVDVEGGDPVRLTWYPSASQARGWTPDGTRILYTSGRESAPTGYARLWTVPAEGGPSTLLPAPFGFRGDFSPDGRRLVVEPTSRWDPEWRGYRGGQNVPLVLLDLETLDEQRIPSELTYDQYPVWLDGKIYFLSDRDWAMNIWSFDPTTGALAQVTFEADLDIRSLSAGDGRLVYAHDGWIHTLDPQTATVERISITVRGDFPWARPRWVDVGSGIRSAGLSPSGRRAVMEARGEIFTIPAEHGSARNLTRSAGAADRSPRLGAPQATPLPGSRTTGRDIGSTLAIRMGLTHPDPSESARPRWPGIRPGRPMGATSPSWMSGRACRSSRWQRGA